MKMNRIKNITKLVDFFMSIKDKVRIEDLTIHEPIFTLKNRQKAKCSVCQEEFANYSLS
jgi:hypothetical protein